MTREEAIRYIRNVLKGREDKRGKTEIDIALDMAIKALEQEPCTDTISRQAAIDACLNGWNKDYKEIVKEIRALPSVTPAEKVGQWTEGGFDFNYWTCSKCEYQPNNDYSKPSYNYCPNCGAKMQEVEE